MTSQRKDNEAEAEKTSMPWRAYGVCVLFISACYLLLYPVYALDTDLWYHLNAGRYILSSFTIPQDSYFSFVTPARPFIDYYWLFQVIAFKLYTFGGYYALIALRVSIYVAITFLILHFLVKGQTPSKLLAFFVGLGVCYALILITRCILIRPHIFTYLFMVLFLLILEDHPKKSNLSTPFGNLMGKYPWGYLSDNDTDIRCLFCGALLQSLSRFTLKRDRRAAVTLSHCVDYAYNLPYPTWIQDAQSSIYLYRFCIGLYPGAGSYPIRSFIILEY